MNGQDLDLSEMADGDEIEVPDEPGPSIAGRTPLVGTVRRSQGAPVLRDELSDELDL